MKKCLRCGQENIDENTFCINCGEPLADIQDNSFTEDNNMIDNDTSFTRPTNQSGQTQLDQQNLDYQDVYDDYKKTNHTQPAKKHKNKYIGSILNLLILGIGYVYLGLYKRFAVFFVLGFVFRLMMTTSSLATIGALLYLIWFVYALYDCYKCAVAINSGIEIPKLLGFKID